MSLNIVTEEYFRRYVQCVRTLQDKYLYYHDDRYYKAVLIWCNHVDIFKMFHFTPILKMEGEHGTGKSQTIMFCAGMVNRYAYLTGYTVASLRNDIDHNNDRGFFLDEQKIKLKEDVLTLLRVGAYRTGGCIQIAGKHPGERIKFKVFAPKAFGTYFPLTDAALESRCFTLYTKRKPDNIFREDAVVDIIRVEATPLREMQSIILKETRGRISEIYAGLRVPELGSNRIFQIYRVLLSIAKAYDEICPDFGFYDAILKIGISQKDRENAERDLSNIERTAFAEALLWYVRTYPMDRDGSFYRLDKIASVLRGSDSRYSGWRIEDLSKGLKKHKFVIKSSRPRFEDPNDSNKVFQATCVVFDVDKLNTIAHSGQN